MIGRGFRRSKPETEETVEVQGFDAYELRLGDMMRGERATMGKSLLDVQRELKIKAAYIAAIENADPSAFDTPGFIAGYVRSYARYLNMDADWAFETFCRESGFETAHGMSAQASTIRQDRDSAAAAAHLGRDIFSASATPFIPAGERMLSGIEPRAVGSIAVLLMLIGGLGYGGYSVLQEVQRVQFAPVEQAPTVLAEVDPLAGASQPGTVAREETDELALPSPEALDRLYRPEALDVPVLVQRDGPIVALDRLPPSALTGAEDVGDVLPQIAGAAGGIAEDAVDSVEDVVALVVGGEEDVPLVQVTEDPPPEIAVIAACEAWVRVRTADGSTIYEATMQAGDSFVIPQTEAPSEVRVGQSAAVYFAINGVPYGPAGPRGAISDNELTVTALTEKYDQHVPGDIAEPVQYADLAGLQVAPCGG